MKTKSDKQKCDYCEKIKAGKYPGAPSHRGYESCRMRGKAPANNVAIAAGGTKAHCTCAGCF